MKCCSLNAYHVFLNLSFNFIYLIVFCFFFFPAGTGWSEGSTDPFFSLAFPCASSHRMTFFRGLGKEQLVPHICKKETSPPGFILFTPMQEFGSLRNLGSLLVSSTYCILYLFKTVKG